MACVNNGKNFALFVSEDDGTTFLKIGGFNSKSFNIDNQTTDVTSSSTQSEFTENAFNGYSTMTISGSGFLDSRIDGSVVGATPYDLLETATTGDRSLYLGFTETGGGSINVEGLFFIQNFSIEAPENGKPTFNATFIPECAGSGNEVSITLTPPTAP